MSRALKAEISDKIARRERIKLRITPTVLSALPDVGRDYRIYDADLRRFHVRVRASGNAVYAFSYRTPSGAERTLTLGDINAMSPDEARGLARKAALETASGGDPVGERAAKRAEATVEDLLEEWLDRPSLRTGKPRSPKTLKDYRGLIAREINPALGRRKVSEVARRDVERFHRGLKDKPTTANRCLEVLSAAFNLAEVLEMRPQRTNPTDHIAGYPEVKRKDVHRLDVADARAYLRALPLAEAAAKAAGSDVTENAALALLIAALRGIRIGEVLSLRWSRMTEDCRRAWINGKTGKREIEMPEIVADRLRGAREQARSDVVIAGRAASKPMEYSTVRKMHRRVVEHAKKLGLSPLVLERLDASRIHDLRHAFLFAAGEHATNTLHLRDAAGHANIAMTSDYIPTYSDPVTELVNRTAAALTEWEN